MKQVIVSSLNPVKIDAARHAFTAMFSDEEFQFTGVSVDSQVADQPFGDETRQGCINRSTAMIHQYPDFDYYVSIEGGTEIMGDELWCTAWCHVSDKTRSGFGKASMFEVPQAIAQLVLKEGYELGHAADKVHNTDNIKQGMGTIGLITDGLITRTSYYHEPLLMALIPHRNPDMY